MAVPKPSFGPDGFITPIEPDILVAVKEQINEAFGGGLNMADKTPQGQIAVSMTAAIGNANDAFLFLSQQFDPAYNIGRYQDAVARIYFIERLPARPTVTMVTCTGLVGVVIPAGSLVDADDGNLYRSLDSAEIPDTGTIDVPFACTVPGPIPCPAGSINRIYMAVNGWDSVINIADGAIGRDTERRDEFEQRRALSVAKNAQGSLPSILGSVLEVDGVLDAFVAENVNNTAHTIRGYTLAANSIYVAVVGGAADAVARALWTKKSPGCGYNGNTTVIVEDQSSGYNPPYPAYEVKFERPSAETVIFSVNLNSNPGIPANGELLVQAAIVAAFAGADGGPRARIGDTLFASRFYAPVAKLGAWAQIVTIKIGCTNTPAARFTGSISGDQLTVTAVTSGIVGVGQSLIGAGITPGTRIIAGAAPTFTLNIIKDVPSTDIVAVVAASDEITLEIDQSPVTTLGNTRVILS